MSCRDVGHRAVHRADGPDRDRAGAAAGDRDRLAAGAQQFPGKTLLETIVSLPLVLPPVASGLLLLWLFGRRSPVGRALDAAGIEIIFTWKAVVIAMMVISFPLVARSVRAGIEQVDRRYEQIAATLGAGPFRILRTITLPLASRGIAAGAVLGFSRALGEFGATIMIAGAIPGRTRTLAVGIYTLVETGREEAAWGLVLISALLAFGAIYVSNRLVDRRGARDRARDRHHAAAGGVRCSSVRESRLGRSARAVRAVGQRQDLAARSDRRHPHAGRGRDPRRRSHAVFVGAAASTCRRAIVTSATCRRTRCCFRNLNVDGNITLWRAQRHRADFDALVEILDLQALLDRRVQNLSGGEKQRVAIARALMTRPSVLLLDEPLAGVDRERRDVILPYVLRIRRELHVPLIYVTHDAASSNAIADRVLHLDRGSSSRRLPRARWQGLSASKRLSVRANRSSPAEAPTQRRPLL